MKPYLAGGCVHADTEDKLWWTEHGARMDARFVDEVAPHLGLDAALNPAKAADPFRPTCWWADSSPT